ncbi:MAG: CapA family protein, partial [Bowdeniella nasicola]|nr:CapA family protein [Bowdeniella nasicola]
EVGPTATSSAPTPTPTPTPSETAAPPVTFTIVAAGDILPHPSVYNAAKRDDGYDFLPQFAHTTPLISAADLALCQMEVPIAPPGTSPQGYPVFAAPPQLVDDLPAAGWDGCTLATNHAADQGFAGLEATVQAFRANNLGYTGVGISDEDRAQVAMYRLTKEGRSITVAHVAGTYGLNGLPDPGDGFQAVNELGDIITAAKRAREAGADIVVAGPQWGEEYQSVPNADQRALAQELADSGAVDIIFGCHPHVPQPIETLTSSDGRSVPIIYSMGNFIHGQSEECCTLASLTGVAVQVEVTASDDGISVGQMRYTPITTDRDAGTKNYRLTALAAGEMSDSTLSQAEAERRLANVVEVMGEDLLTTDLPAGGADVELLDRQ